jgi:hypothetical protein
MPLSLLQMEVRASRPGPVSRPKRASPSDGISLGIRQALILEGGVLIGRIGVANVSPPQSRPALEGADGDLGLPAKTYP